MNVDQLVELVLIASGGGLLAETIRSLVQRRKMRADVAGELTRSALTLLQPLTDRLTVAEGEVAELRTQLGAARDECDQLRAELGEARTELAELRGVTPPPPPRP